ncbi:MAG: amino acid permease, partial [Planctomycetota bacterium]
MNTPQPKKTLSVFDSVCIIVGIIIGAGIYETAPLVAGSMGSGTGTLAIWLLGGLIALAGALNYSELATTYPRQGGDYVYLTYAFGRPTGFLFGWTQL